MNEENFLIKFIPSKNCFLQFNNKWFQKLNTPKCSCLRLAHPVTKQELRFTWSPQPSYGLNDCSVGINATFCNVLNLQENELVVISSEDRIVPLTQVFLVPLSSDDYEILEMSQDIVEESLLDQIRVVNVKQIVSVWVSKTVHLKLTVDRLVPELSFGKLEQSTEVVIENVNKPGPLRPSHGLASHPQHTKDSSELESEDSFWNSLTDYIPFHELKAQNSSDTLGMNKFKHSPENSLLMCRVHPFPDLKELVGCCNQCHDESIHPFNVFVRKDTLDKDCFQLNNTSLKDLFKIDNSAIVCRVQSVPLKRSNPPNTKGPSGVTQKENSVDTKDTVTVCVRLYKIEESCEYFKRERTKMSCVYVSRFLMKVLDLKVGGKVHLTVFRPSLGKMLNSISLVPSTELSESEAEALVQEFTSRLPCRDGVLVNNDCPLPLDPPVLVRLRPADLPCWPLTRSQLEVCPVTVAIQPESSLGALTQQGLNEAAVFPQVTSVFEELVKEGVNALAFGLGLYEDQYQGRFLDNILITGKQGSGKSRLAQAILSKVSGPPHYIHVNILDCRSLKGKKPESIGKIVLDCLSECVYYGPAVLVLEDLQCVAGAPTADLEPSAEGGYFLRVATVLRELLWDQRDVCVLATAESRQQIHPQILSARGRHMFTTFLYIPPLLKAQRVQLLSELVCSRLGQSQPLSSVLEEAASKTEGCMTRDLCRLLDRALFSACRRNVQEISLTVEDLDAALQGFVPEGLANVSLTHHSPHSFASVGGLAHAKQLITEALIWPTKYREVFSQCPLRLERGVLLYGAPGTGKTLLASAVAGECGLSFITVKGPELLSKYIGASEEAVRNLFQKAQMAQPCILFFDEFDSLAPRRGHDSTGVTDRVVNQLLTQMDGVEALEGVWVIAAASRPDLLDPALLRPGRIGTLVHCTLPSQEERLDILENLSHKLELSGDINMAEIAAQTKDFTGADLQALLFTAQMAAYESTHSDSEDEMQLTAPIANSVVVSQAHLLAALKDTSPSLKPQDKERFEKIYERFQKSREIGERIPQASTQRVTLA